MHILQQCLSMKEKGWYFQISAPQVCLINEYLWVCIASIAQNMIYGTAIHICKAKGTKMQDAGVTLLSYMHKATEVMTKIVSF